MKGVKRGLRRRGIRTKGGEQWRGNTSVFMRFLRGDTHANQFIGASIAHAVR